MKDLSTMLADLRRPSLLIRAARAGQPQYNRKAHLRRVLGVHDTIRTAEAVMRLMEIEAELDADRRTGAAHYSAVRHVDVMVALMAEGQLLSCSQTA